MSKENDGHERLPEVGGILHLEHFNFEMQDHELATLFFMNGLGLTRDPYKRTDETNMGVNIGLQQFHLPRRGNPTPPFYGEIGLIVPDLAAAHVRLERVQKLGHFDGTQYEMMEVSDDQLLVQSPWGVCMRLWRPGVLPFQRPLGLVYVDIPVAPGTAEKLSAFYVNLLAAPFQMEDLDGETSAVVSAGPYQQLRFRERELEDYNLYAFHVAYYISNYNRVRDTAIGAGVLLGEGKGQVCFIEGPFDPETGELLLAFQQEWRSVYHPDFMRPLVNRWPMEAEPFSEQGEIVAALAHLPGRS